MREGEGGEEVRREEGGGVQLCKHDRSGSC